MIRPIKTGTANQLHDSYIQIMTMIHLDDWNKLPCPICDEETWYRCFERIDYNVIGVFGWGA
jgi:hypothetical protein